MEATLDVRLQRAVLVVGGIERVLQGGVALGQAGLVAARHAAAVRVLEPQSVELASAQGVQVQDFRGVSQLYCLCREHAGGQQEAKDGCLHGGHVRS